MDWCLVVEELNNFFSNKQYSMEVLENFVIDYLSNTSAISDALSYTEKDFEKNYLSVNGGYRKIQYRNKPFQVEIFKFTCPFGEFIIPEHHHPNVDSFEVYICGDIDFSHGGTWLSRWDRKDYRYIDINQKKILTPPAGGKSGTYKDFSNLTNMDAFVVRVKTNDIHGAYIGPHGGTFMSVQHWLNDVDPSSVGYDYDGYGISHQQTKYDGVKYKESDWKIVASKETSAIMWDEINDRRFWECITPNYNTFKDLTSPSDYYYNK